MSEYKLEYNDAYKLVHDMHNNVYDKMCSNNLSVGFQGSRKHEWVIVTLNGKTSLKEDVSRIQKFKEIMKPYWPLHLWNGSDSHGFGYHYLFLLKDLSLIDNETKRKKINWFSDYVLQHKDIPEEDVSSNSENENSDGWTRKKVREANGIFKGDIPWDKNDSEVIAYSTITGVYAAVKTGENPFLYRDESLIGKDLDNFCRIAYGEGGDTVYRTKYLDNMCQVCVKYIDGYDHLPEE